MTDGHAGPVRAEEDRPFGRAPAGTLLLDTDNAFGLPFCDVDDGLALLFLLAQPGSRLCGITLTHGNAPLAGVRRATERLLARVPGPVPPVFPGARGPARAPTAAARFLVDATTSSPGRLRIVAIGPLSNLAAAAALDPRFFARCAEVICLGGTVGPASLGRRRLREVNFAADENAARVVLATRDCPVTVVPTTSCLGLTFGATDLPALPPRLRGAVRRWLLCCRLWRGIPRVVLWDLLPALWAVRPDLLVTEAATVGLGRDGVLAVAPGGPHRLVRGLSDPVTAKALVLEGIGRALGGGSQGERSDPPPREGGVVMGEPGARGAASAPTLLRREAWPARDVTAGARP